MKTLVKDRLIPNHRLFCRYYATNEVGTRGNGTRSYMKAYPNSLETTGAVNSFALLRKTNILTELKRLWSLTGLTDEEVDAQLAGLVRQDSDLKSKLGGIKEYNALKSRVKSDGQPSVSKTLIQIVINSPDGKINRKVVENITKD